MELNLDTSKKLLESKMSNQNLKRHCYAVGFALSALYDYFKNTGDQRLSLSKEEWECVGILHDSDWELTAKNPEKHTVELLEWLKEYEVSDEIKNVFRSHNNKTTHLREPETLLEWSLECVDELTGFIVATTLVMPTKRLAQVGVENVLKKFKQKEFAKAVDRSQIAQCEEKLGIPLDKFVQITLTSMQEKAGELGL